MRIRSKHDDSGRTKKHAAVVQQVAEMFEHGSLIDTSRTTEIAQETTACDHHVGRRILHRYTTNIESSSSHNCNKTAIQE